MRLGYVNMSETEIRNVLWIQASKIVYRGYSYFKNKKCSSDNLQGIKQKTSHASGVLVRIVHRIVGEGNSST